MRHWLIGACPFVKVVMIIMYGRRGNTNQVKGKIELYVLRRKWRPGPPAKSSALLAFTIADQGLTIITGHLSRDSVRVLTWDQCRRSRVCKSTQFSH
ncbi:hypothetical protein V8F44DRAFT_602247 [Aspergillus fumigatus]